MQHLKLQTIGELLYYFPTRWSDAAEIKPISALVTSETASIYGTATNIKLSKGFRSHVAMAHATITDATGEIDAIWFHQQYIAKMLAEGTSAKFTGKISQNKKGLYISNPEFERIDKAPDVGHSLFGEGVTGSTLFPIYPETRGITSRWIFHTIQKIFTSGVLDSITDPIPDYILKKYNLPGLKTALIWMHTPQKMNDALAAEKRFAFEEIFLIQIGKQRDRLKNEKSPSFAVHKNPEEILKFTSRFPFKETNAQHKAIETIMNDFSHGAPMSRLLEGDVGRAKPPWRPRRPTRPLPAARKVRSSEHFRSPICARPKFWPTNTLNRSLNIFITLAFQLL